VLHRRMLWMWYVRKIHGVGGWKRMRVSRFSREAEVR
jgi:hypothetical protein